VTRGPLGRLLIIEGNQEAEKDRELYFILGGQARVEVRGTRVATLKYVEDSNIQFNICIYTYTHMEGDL
jgi:hypothetical protein